MTDRMMYDSTNMDAIPVTAEIVAGYPYAFPTDYTRFPKALQVKIDQHGNHADTCHVADGEAGALTTATMRQWVQSWHLLHPNGLAAVNGFFDVPTVYFNTSNAVAYRQALAGLLYDAWQASWGVGPTVISGTSLHQYESPTESKIDADVSVVYDATWGVRPSLGPAPVATRTEVIAYINAHLA
jgi:hypothetical protein